MSSVPPRRRRARPVADAPIDALLTRSDDLTRGWLLAMLEQVPLDQAPEILTADLIRDGPRVCEAVLRAIVDDTDLRRLEPGGALTPMASHVGELAGAGTPATTAWAVDALQGVIWTALRDELRSPAPDLVAELAERLALVAELLRAAALARLAPSARGGRGELSAVPPREGTGEPAGESGGSLWVSALEDEIRRAAGSSLALLLAELEDFERVASIETAEQARTTFGHFAGAVRSAVRHHDILVCETDTRAWIIARDTARTGARALGARIARAVGEAQQWRGAPLTASLGVAVLGEDGRTSSELIEAAEEARFAAAAG